MSFLMALERKAWRPLHCVLPREGEVAEAQVSPGSQFQLSCGVPASGTTGFHAVPTESKDSFPGIFFVYIIDGFVNITLKDGVYWTFFKNSSRIYQQPFEPREFERVKLLCSPSISSPVASICICICIVRGYIHSFLHSGQSL